MPAYCVHTSAAPARRHTQVPSTPCVSYWDDPRLSKSELQDLLRRANKDDVAFSIASFSGTPVATIRAAIAESNEILCLPASDDRAEFAALC